jgi:hypothetical protein
VQKLGSECVSSTTDQTLIGHGFHSPIQTQLSSGVAPLDVTHECGLSELTAVAWHTEMHSSGSQIVNIDLDILLIGLRRISWRGCGRLGVSHVYSIKVVYYLQSITQVEIFF